MKLFISVGDDGVITGIATSLTADFPDEVEVSDPVDPAKLSGYEVVTDATGKNVLKFDQERYDAAQKAAELSSATQSALTALQDFTRAFMLEKADDAQAYAMKALYPEWKPDGTTWPAGQRLQWKGRFWKTLKETTTQASWTPDTATSEFVEITDPSITWPEYKQPTDAVDAYAKGARVTFDGQHYVSRIDSNVHSPKEDPASWEKQENT